MRKIFVCILCGVVVLSAAPSAHAWAGISRVISIMKQRHVRDCNALAELCIDHNDQASCSQWRAECRSDDDCSALFQLCMDYHDQLACGLWRSDCRETLDSEETLGSRQE